MLGSPALELPFSRRFELNVAVGGNEAKICDLPEDVFAA
jgi:hypothetical protein